MADPRTEELVRFALDALPAMQTEDGLFCHEVVAPGERRSGGRLGRGERTPAGGGMARFGRSLRYTLVVLIGSERARRAGLEPRFDLAAARAAPAQALSDAGATPGDLGLALWAAIRMDGGTDGAAERLAAASTPAALAHLEGHELAWLMIGCAASHRGATPEAGTEAILARLTDHLIARSRTPSGLLRRADRGRTARFPHFATQIYGVLALVEAEAAGAAGGPLEVARRVADRLLDAQRPDGAWPWLYDSQGGAVVEPYRLYSVHQGAMAPMALNRLSQATGDPRYRDAAARGLEWVFGGNELGVQMLDRDAGMLYRSINRRGIADRTHLWANMARVGAGLRPGRARSRSLEIERTDRPYHLGWVLEAWAGGSD